MVLTWVGAFIQEQVRQGPGDAWDEESKAGVIGRRAVGEGG